MVSENYKPAMKPELRPAGEIRRPGKEPTPYPAQIVVSGPCFSAMSINLLSHRKTLKAALCGSSICPMQYFFLDTPEVRRILGVPE